MLFNLVKKDFILAKKYLLFLLIFPIAAPIFVISKIPSSYGGCLGFFITVFYSEYMLLNTVSISEDKYKGSALLCSTPYTRNALVKAKYLSMLIIFIFTYIIYTITTIVVPLGIVRLNIFTFGLSLLMITIFFGIIIPLQYQFGYEKTKNIFFAIIFLTPFGCTTLLKWQISNNISSLQIKLPFPQIVQDLLPFLLAIIIVFVSMNVSVHIYSKKDL